MNTETLYILFYMKNKQTRIFYAPNFEEVDGAYWFGPVHLSVMPFVGCNTREPLELRTLNFICSISTKNKQMRIFSIGPSMAKLCPFFDCAIIATE